MNAAMQEIAREEREKALAWTETRHPSDDYANGVQDGKEGGPMRDEYNAEYRKGYMSEAEKWDECND